MAVIADDFDDKRRKRGLMRAYIFKGLESKGTRRIRLKKKKKNRFYNTGSHFLTLLRTVDFRV